MADAPKHLADNTVKIIQAWETIAPDATFAKMTLTQYKQAVQPSVDARNTLQSLRTQITAAEAARAKADVVTNPLNQEVVNSIKGDPAYGEDSDLYAAMGYVRKSARKSGLTRKKNNPVALAK